MNRPTDYETCHLKVRIRPSVLAFCLLTTDTQLQSTTQPNQVPQTEPIPYHFNLYYGHACSELSSMAPNPCGDSNSYRDSFKKKKKKKKGERERGSKWRRLLPGRATAERARCALARPPSTRLREACAHKTGGIHARIFPSPPDLLFQCLHWS